MAIYVLVHGAFGGCWQLYKIQAEHDMEQSRLAELLLTLVDGPGGCQERSAQTLSDDRISVMS